MKRVFSILTVILTTVELSTINKQLQCIDPSGKPVDWFAAIKLPKISDVSDGTVYIYMDVEKQEWTFLTGITTENSAIGHTVTQMYAPTKTYNDSILWIVYNDDPSNTDTTSTLGHTKGMVAADKQSGFWLVHSVPNFPVLPYQNKNSYTYPETGVKYGQSFLCVSMVTEELDKVGNQLINNEVSLYGSHFGGNLKSTYPDLYKSTLPRKKPGSDNDGVRLQSLRTIEGVEFLSISKNRNFEKDLYEDLITQMTKSNLYTETWLNTRDSFNSSCSGKYKTMNIKSLSMENVKGMNKSYSYSSSKDHSKWVITATSSVPRTCIGDINRGNSQTKRGGGTVCIDSVSVWNQFNKLIADVEKCKK